MTNGAARRSGGILYTFGMELTDTALCWNCGGKIAPVDKYCRHCGKGQGGKLPWYYSHAGIIAITLLGLGPFSLGYVWKSPRLSREAKWVYTVLILVLTWYLVSYVYDFYTRLTATLTGLQGYGVQ